MKIAEYLERINYRGELTPSLLTLQKLQESHLQQVPFENLDIALKRTITLDLEKIYQKIVIKRRGGFCFELNSLFNWLLQNLGFESNLVSGRVYDKKRQDYGPEFDHLTILVQIGQDQWISDVGFGDFVLHPLPLIINTPLDDPGGQFIIEKHPPHFFRISRYNQQHNTLFPVFLFSAIRRQLSEFQKMCDYHQTSPKSHFTQKRVCSIATPTGRITLTDKKLIITSKANREEFTIKNDQEFELILKKYFDIQL